MGVVSDPLEPYVRMAELLDTAPGIVYCVKTADSRYVAVNHAFAARVGRADRREVVGHRAVDLFPADQAERYEHQDRAVLASGRSVRDELELISDRAGLGGWFVTNKQAIRDASGRIVGVAALSVDLRRRQDDRAEVDAFAAVMTLASEHLSRTVEVAELAAVAGLSQTQLERRMRRAFGLSPRQYLLRIRVDEAIRRLAGTDEPLADIAHACGWYDQSAFTRQFTRVAGCTPGEYRHRSHR
jgi:PAS domain S-box-containing protein